MILTDREIVHAVTSGDITIDPTPNFEDAISSSALDLTLSPEAFIWNSKNVKGVNMDIDPTSPGYDHNKVIESHATRLKIPREGHVMEPGDFLLGFTAEKVTLPVASKIAARVEGKSSLARVGLAVHVTAPTIHIGFQGVIQLEICNLGPLRVRLTPRRRVCQLIFEQTLGMPDKGYQGQFLGQTTG